MDLDFLAHLLDLRAALSVAHLAKMMDQNGKKFSELSWECVPVSQAVVEAFLGRRMQEAVEAKEGLLSQGAGQAEKEVFRKVILFVSF
jgi:acyl-CoA oxidase